MLVKQFQKIQYFAHIYYEHPMSKYHTRKGYEQMLLNILRERGSSFKPNLRNISDYQLLVCINTELRKANCNEFEKEEFEMELH